MDVICHIRCNISVLGPVCNVRALHLLLRTRVETLSFPGLQYSTPSTLKGIAKLKTCYCTVLITAWGGGGTVIQDGMRVEREYWEGGTVSGGIEMEQGGGQEGKASGTP